MIRFLPAVLILATLGCTSEEARVPARAGMIAELDTLADQRQVSVSGSVLEIEDNRTVMLHDQTGLVRVSFPEDLAIGEGQRLTVLGRIRHSDQGPVIDANSWVYDSTAAPVRSP